MGSRSDGDDGATGSIWQAPGPDAYTFSNGMFTQPIHHHSAGRVAYQPEPMRSPYPPLDALVEAEAMLDRGVSFPGDLKANNPILLGRCGSTHWV